MLGLNLSRQFQSYGKVAAALAMGAEHLFNREGIIVYRKEVNRVPLYKYRGFGVNSMNKTGGRRKCL